MRKYRIDATMITRNNRTRKYLLASLLLLVGMTLFVMQTYSVNYNIYVPVVAMVIICGMGQTMKNVKNVSYSHMATYLLDGRYEFIKRLVG